MESRISDLACEFGAVVRAWTTLVEIVGLVVKNQKHSGAIVFIVAKSSFFDSKPIPGISGSPTKLFSTGVLSANPLKGLKTLG